MHEFKRKWGKIAYYQAEDKLYEQLTVREYLSFFAKLANVSFEEMNMITNIYGICELKNTKIGKLSNIQEFMVCLARIDLQADDIGFLIEPFQGMSSEELRACVAGIKKLTARVKVVIFSGYLKELRQLELPIYAYDEIDQKLISIAGTDSKLILKTSGEVNYIPVDEITYIESITGKSIIYGLQQYNSQLTLRELELKLPSFYRCHRSYLVNLLKIKEIVTYGKNSYGVILEDGGEIPLSRTKVKELKNMLSGTI